MHPHYTIDRDAVATYLTTNSTIGISLTGIICHEELAQEHGQVAGHTIHPSDTSSLRYFGGRKFIRANGSINYRGLYDFGFRAADLTNEMSRLHKEVAGGPHPTWTAHQDRLYTALARAHWKLTFLDVASRQIAQ